MTADADRPADVREIAAVALAEQFTYPRYGKATQETGWETPILDTVADRLGQGMGMVFVDSDGCQSIRMVTPQEAADTVLAALSAAGLAVVPTGEVCLPREAAVTCPRRSPESDQPCVLPDTSEAHRAGHESARVDSSRACWATDDADHARWADPADVVFAAPVRRRYGVVPAVMAETVQYCVTQPGDPMDRQVVLAESREQALYLANELRWVAMQQPVVGPWVPVEEIIDD